MTEQNTTAVIGLGSNLGDRAQQLSSAAAALHGIGAELARSPLYETAPIGPPQPAYLNAVVLLRTPREPEAILRALLAIEASMGRVRRERWGPRTIDLDLLMFGEHVMRTPLLTLPHPEIAHRAFVLQPWADVAPSMQVPGLGTVRELLAKLPEADRQGLRFVAEQW